MTGWEARKLNNNETGGWQPEQGRNERLATLHPTLSTLHSEPYTPHPTPRTPHPTPYTPHPTRTMTEGEARNLNNDRARARDDEVVLVVLDSLSGCGWRVEG